MNRNVLQVGVELLANDGRGFGFVTKWPSRKMEGDFREEDAKESREDRVKGKQQEREFAPASLHQPGRVYEPGGRQVRYIVAVSEPSRLLDLWKQHLGNVPEYVWERTELQALILADNSLNEISEKIGGLKRLRMLDLGHNQLTRLPDALGEIVDLSDFLYLHDNRLVGLPDPLGRLTKLRYLNISENSFSAVPASVCEMVGLLELRITDNQLTSLPEEIGKLSRLRELHLRNNQLISLPRSVGRLRELRQLDLRGNPLRELPRELASLPRLEKLDLRWVNTLPGVDWLGQLEAHGCLVYR